MTLNDLPNLTFVVHPDDSMTSLDVTPQELLGEPLEVDFDSRRVHLSRRPGQDFNPWATRLCGAPVFGPAIFYGK